MHGYEPCTEEIENYAASIGIKNARVILPYLLGEGEQSLYKPISDYNEEYNTLSVVPVDEPPPDREAEITTVTKAIRTIIGKMDSRTGRILYDRLFGGMTLREIGGQYGLTDARISQIVKRSRRAFAKEDPYFMELLNS